MDVGDLFQWQGRTWLVRNVDEASITAYAENAEGTVLQADLHQESNPDVQVLCNPIRDWPSVSLPMRTRAKLVEVQHRGRPLARFQDWVKIDEWQMGGLLFLNPALNLGFRDRLIAVFMSGERESRTPLNIPRDFLSLEQKMERFNAPPPQPQAPPPKPPKPTIYDALISDDDDL